MTAVSGLGSLQYSNTVQIPKGQSATIISGNELAIHSVHPMQVVESYRGEQER